VARWPKLIRGPNASRGQPQVAQNCAPEKHVGLAGRLVGRPRRAGINLAAAARRTFQQAREGGKFNVGITGQELLEAEHDTAPTSTTLGINADGLT
jgi:hypothetical protein